MRIAPPLLSIRAVHTCGHENSLSVNLATPKEYREAETFWRRSVSSMPCAYCRAVALRERSAHG